MANFTPDDMELLKRLGVEDAQDEDRLAVIKMGRFFGRSIVGFADEVETLSPAQQELAFSTFISVLVQRFFGPHNSEAK